MRFLCEQCKAKYQIADEKVAGKTVRMKCRKCGHLIEVKAEVTETSVASKAPAQAEPPEGDAPEDATRVGMDVNSMMKLSPGPPKAPAAKPPRPQGAGLATSLAAAKPAARPASSATAAGRSHAGEERGSALAGAFQKSVKDEGMLELSTSSEWYCAINGVPVGPVRIAELRRKASSGNITEESLVWQEGMEEWRPLRTVPELLAIVNEGLTSERPSLVTSAPHARPPRPSTPPTHGVAQGAPPAAPAHAPRAESKSSPSHLPGRSNVVSLSSRLATAEKLEPELEEVRDPFAARSPQDKSPISGIDPMPPAPVAGVFGAPLGSVAAPTVVIPRKQGPNWVVIGMVVAFGAFGATAGVAVFFKQPQAAQPAPTFVVNTQAAPTATGTGATASTGNVTEIATVNLGGSDPAGPHNAGGAGHNAGGTAATGTASGGRVVDPSIAALLGGPGGGPSIGGNGTGGSTSSALSEESIQRVVQQRSAGVKRTCWERGGATESNVNVRVKLNIAATGNVQSATSEGNDPIVNKCIENSVRGWQFPVSSGSTQVEIPFHFLRQ